LLVRDEYVGILSYLFGSLVYFLTFDSFITESFNFQYIYYLHLPSHLTSRLSHTYLFHYEFKKKYYNNPHMTGSGPNSRTSELFISYGTNPGLGIELWETPFGEVIEGMEHVEALHSYGDMVRRKKMQLFIYFMHLPAILLSHSHVANCINGSLHNQPPWGHGPVQPKIRNKPNYIRDEFPLLDKFETCTVQVFKPGDSDSGGADEIGRVSHHAVGSVTREQQRRAREKHNDDPVETEKRQSEAIDEVQKMLGPFENGFQLGMVVVGVVLFLLILAVTRRGRGTEKKAN